MTLRRGLISAQTSAASDLARSLVNGFLPTSPPGRALPPLARSYRPNDAPCDLIAVAQALHSRRRALDSEPRQSVVLRFAKPELHDAKKSKGMLQRARGAADAEA